LANVHKNVAIIGGGCAGLSAAVALVDYGYDVTVFDASGQLGGRARTVAIENNGLLHQLDNGQHILLGAYRETLALLHKVGIDENQAFLRQPLAIKMQSNAEKTIFSLKSAHYLPAPLNLLVGLLSCKGLYFSERIAAIQLMHHLKKSHYKIANDQPLATFLIEQKQSAKLIQMLWEPLCLAALNTPIAIASSQIFLNVLKDSFSGSKKNCDFLLPKQDLSRMIATPLAQYIQSKGGQIKRNRRVSNLQAEGDVFSLETKDGKAFFSHVIIAVPPASLDTLVETLPNMQAALKLSQTYSHQPIYTIYLQYPPDTILPEVMIGLTDTLGQWVFDRGQLCNQKGLFAVIVSAAGAHQLLSHDELALTIAKEIHLAFPNMPKPLWHKVIAEKRATFSCTPDLARLSNKTSQPNLYLAGDYTYADYPATIEGAVRSGIACANLITNS
jgi:squalene-associated FAD-dependent desaturase